MMKRYAAGERSAEFLTAYMPTLASAYMQQEVSKVTVEYLNTLPAEQLVTQENWALINQYVSDPLSAPLKQVMANRKKFYRIASKNAVDDKLAYCIHAAVGQLVDWNPETNAIFDEKRNKALTDYLQHIDFFSVVPTSLANLYTAAYVRKKDFRGLLDKMKEVLSYNMFQSIVSKGRYFQRNIEALTQCEDKKLVEEGIQLIDLQCAATNDYSIKSKLMSSKALLQNKIGDTQGARKSEMEADQYIREREKKREARMKQLDK